MPATDDYIYLSSMQELADWRPESASTHSSNISNTPLCPRAPAPAPATSPPDTKLSRVLLCHDYRGGHHPTERTQGVTNPEGSEDPYTAEYLHLATDFAYFAHYRVVVPPAPWTNVCHRHGVRSLGTLLFEHDEASADAGRLFEKGSEGEFFFATQLVRMAETYGFDGWLVNVEAELPREKWRVGVMQAFLGELRAGIKVKGGTVVWYDALTVLNSVHYQNGLTLLNAPWLHVTDALFSNYWWRTRELIATKRVAEAMGRTKDVFMGIDCYGRGSMGGGGFGVGEPLKEVRNAGLQATALFAPGWTWEHFQGLGFRGVERKFWGVVGEHVVAHPAGSRDGFYTCFNRGFGDRLFMKGKLISETKWIHLGAQSLLPHFPSTTEISHSLDSTKAWTGSWSLKLALTSASSPSTSPTFAPLFRLSVALDQNLLMTYKLQRAATSSTAGVYWDIRHPSTGATSRRTSPLEAHYPGRVWGSGMPNLAEDGDADGSTVVEMGVFFSGGALAGEELWLGEVLMSTLEKDGLPDSTISSVVVRPAAEAGKMKLSWSVYPGGRRRGKGMWSEQTKEFAYFLVWKGEQLRGAAYACEFVAGAAEAEGGEEWRVSGVTWDGRKVIQGSAPSAVESSA